MPSSLVFKSQLLLWKKGVQVLFLSKLYLFLINIYLFLALVDALRIFDLHCSMGDLLVAAFKFLVLACGIQFPDQGLNLGSLH